MCAPVKQAYEKAKETTKKVVDPFNVSGKVVDAVHENVDRGINKVGQDANFFGRLGEFGSGMTTDALTGSGALRRMNRKFDGDQDAALLLKKRLGSGATDEVDALTKKKRLDAIRSGLAATVATSPLGVSSDLTPGTNTTLGKR
jgi:hypothetical protein